MKDTKKKNKSSAENPMKGYNRTARDFEFTEEHLDDVNKSEKEQVEANKRTEKGNTKPNKEKMN